MAITVESTGISNKHRWECWGFPGRFPDDFIGFDPPYQCAMKLHALDFPIFWEWSGLVIPFLTSINCIP